MARSDTLDPEESKRTIARNKDRINAAAELARESTVKARVAVSQIEAVDANRPAVRTLMEAAELSSQAMHALLEAGAVLPSPESKKERFALSELTQLSTPTATGLLELLRIAQVVAEQVDAERGRVLPEDLPLQPGESRGVDLAEQISELVLRLQLEVEGPKGLDQ